MSISFKYKNYFKKNINSFLLSKGYSKDNIYHLIKNKNVYVDGNCVFDKNHKLSFLSVIDVTLNQEKNMLVKTNETIDILYEDDYLLIVNKPYGIDVEPTKSNNDNSLSNYISYYYQINNIKSKIHLVNRLDKMTTGIVILAKNQYIHNLFKNVKIKKKYLALLKGKINKKGVVKVKIKKDENSSKRIVDEKGKETITKYRFIKNICENSLVEIDLLTGKTHQIRVAMSHVNHPLLSDPLYGSDSEYLMYLNAYYVKFKHPINNKKIIVTKINPINKKSC